MADPILSCLSLANLSRQYTVFESDQVLTYDQLNSLTDYLNDQARLTRVELLGVGIVTGLDVYPEDDEVIRVLRGLGITTDGDLLFLPSDTVYDRFKPYDTSAPRYNPLYVNDTMLTVYELVPQGASDAAAQPLYGNPSFFSDGVVVMLMESYQFDPDICSGTDCDNLGKTAIDNPRMLWVRRQDAGPLVSELKSACDVALLLPELHVARPKISPLTVGSIGELTKSYLDVCNSIHGTLMEQIGTYHEEISAVMDISFGGYGYSYHLKRHNDRFNNATGGFGVQYYYDFLKDVVDNWNELREVLFLDDSLLCPDLNAFPKHLVLGDFSYPKQMRTKFFPSPVVGESRTHREHAKFLAQKLYTIIATFNLPAVTNLEIMVTPSRSEAASLEDRAIPYYYDPGSNQPIHRDWNFRLTKRGAGTSNYGYWAKKYGGTELAQNPLASQIGRYDFFRIEGHLGQNVTTARNKIQEIIRENNLPFLVRAVLLHHDRSKIIMRPMIRYGDLHRMHYLLRNEVATNLGDSTTFNEKFKQGVGEKFAGQPIVDTSNTKHAKVKAAVEKVQPAMAKRSYTAYSSDSKWKSDFPQIVSAATEFKTELGEFVRNDLPTPFDSVASTNYPAWLDWLDTIIKAKDDQEDDKLLMGSFINLHPAFEHCGGVGRGGTFVLIYSEEGVVVGDFALPYSWPEVDEKEPVEPDLKPPEFRLPRIEDSVKLKLPIDTLISMHFQTKIEPALNAKLDIQKDYFKFFKDSVGAFSDIVKPSGPIPIIDRPIPRDFRDEMLALTMHDIQTRANQIDQMRAIVARPDLPAEQQDAGMKRIDTMEADLAKTIVGATQYISNTKMDITTEADGGKALGIIASSAGVISGTGAKAQLQEGLKATQNQSVGSHSIAVGNLIKIVR